MRRTPLGWYNLLHDRTRSLVAIAGVAFALTAIFMQSGFLQSVLRTATIVTDKLDYDLVIISDNYLYLAEPSSFARPYIYQARAIPGVRAVVPISIFTSTWRNPERRPGTDEAIWEQQQQRRPVLVIGFDLADHPFRSQDSFRAEEVEAARDRLKEADAVLVDRRSRREYGPLEVGLRPEIGLRRRKVVGLFSMGTGFAADGAIIVGEPTFARIAGRDRLARPNLGLVQLDPGADPDAVARGLAALLPAIDVQVMTRAAFRASEKWYWIAGKSIGVIFLIGVSVAFLVGVVVVYQVLSSDIADHLAEYATLKAMGYTAGRLATIVLQQGLIIAAAAYVPALAVSWLLYLEVERRAMIPIAMHPWIAGPLLVAAAIMCATSAVVSLRKVHQADPADMYLMMPLFRSRRLPLAWLNLTHDPLRLLTSLSGIVFSVILMFMEYGFWNALMDSTAELVRKLDADDNDLIMISASKHTLAAKAWFSRRRLYEARQFAAVEAAYPIFIEARASIWRNPVSGRARKIRILAFNPDEPVFRPDVVSRAAAEALKRPDTALIDVLSKPVYGRPEAGVAAVLSRRPIRIVGTFRLGTDFVTDGNLIMSDQNYLRYVPDRRLDPPDLRDVDLGLLKVAPDADLPAVVAALRRRCPATSRAPPATS